MKNTFVDNYISGLYRKKYIREEELEELFLDRIDDWHYDKETGENKPLGTYLGFKTFDHYRLALEAEEKGILLLFMNEIMEKYGRK